MYHWLELIGINFWKCAVHQIINTDHEVHLHIATCSYLIVKLYVAMHVYMFNYI